MTLKMYIKQLQKLAKKYPDAVLICASDDEGNSFHTVYNGPTEMYFDENNGEAYGKEETWCDDENFQVAICIN
jgi:hypothetical protein